MRKEREILADTRREQIAQAAVGVFLRYGFSRTTMGDIAKTAGLTRPTLYQSFADKDAVFASVIDVLAQDMFAKLRTGLASHTGLEARLRFACDVWGVGGFETVLANPNAQDMFDLHFAPVQKVYAEFESFVADILRDPLEQSDLDVSPEELARVISFSIKGFKSTAPDGCSLRRMIEAQLSVIVAALMPSSNGVKAPRARAARKASSSKQ